MKVWFLNSFYSTWSLFSKYSDVHSQAWHGCRYSGDSKLNDESKHSDSKDS